jgi:phage gp45-like
MKSRLGTITEVFSKRGASKNDIDVQVKLVGNNEPVFARLVNSYNSIYYPKIGTPCIVSCVNNENNLWAWAINPDDVMRINEGEKVIFDKAGNKVYLKADGGILIETLQGSINVSSQGNINVNALNINITGNVNITGDLDVSGSSNLQGTTIIETKPFLTHIHTGVVIGPDSTGGVV